MRARVQHVVSTADLATAMGSGDVEVLATPRLLAWCEEATMRVVDGALDHTDTTVGMRVRIDHLLPTPVGGSVDIDAVLALVEGRRLTFDVAATADGEMIGMGQVVRVVVNRQRFLERATSSGLPSPDQ
jgi:predicted thioesterase